MKEELVVRFAEEADLEQINRIRKQVHELHSGGRPDVFKTDGWGDIEDLVKKQLAAEDRGVIAASLGNEIVGFATVQYIHKKESLFQQAQDFYEIGEFGVDEGYRRRGIATQMIDFIRKDAFNRGFRKLELNMWEFNEEALKFYESVGFQTYRRYLEAPVDRM